MPIESNIGKDGRIVSGEYAGYEVRIVDDSKATGGYLILTWKDDPKTGFDNWVETVDDLEQFFRESGWIIEWPA
jgi:hypothetical protein